MAAYFRSLIFPAFLLIASAGYAQAQYASERPSLSERMGQLRNSLFGGADDSDGLDQRPPQRAASARASTPLRGGPSRPSQTAAVGPGYGVANRSFSGTSAMGAHPANPGRGGHGRAAATGTIDEDNIPTLARRPVYGPTTPSAATGNTLPLSARLGSRSTAGGASANPTSVSNNGEAPSSAIAVPTSSRRVSPFSPQVTAAAEVPQTVNPAAMSFSSDSPSGRSPLGRPNRPAVAGPVAAPAVQSQFSPLDSSATAIQTPTSSRRGFSAVSPTDRLASASPERSVSAQAGSDVLFTRQSPLIGIETSGPRTMVVGKEGAYTVSIQNAGEVAANEVVVTIRVPEWADVVGSKETAGVANVPPSNTGDPQAGSGVASQPRAVLWSLPRLEAKSKEQLTLHIVPRQSRPFDLAVQWDFTPVAQSTVVQVQEPKLAMNLSGPPDVLFGDTKVYKLTLSNPGTGDAENVVIHLSPLAGDGGAPTHHPIGTIKAADSRAVEIELTARQAGEVAIHAEATADGDLHAETSQKITVRRAELQLKIAGAKARYAGTMAVYQIEVVNAGNAPAEDVKVTAALPIGGKFLSASSGGQLTTDGGKVQWTVPTIRAGGDAVLQLKCQVTTPGANRLAVGATAVGDLTAAAEDVTQVDAFADLKLDVIEPKGPIAVGADVNYEIHLLNRGSKSATDVKVVGYFSGKIEPTAASGTEHRIVPGIVIFKPIASLSPGSEVVFKIAAMAKAPGHHMFRAEVTCESAGAKLGSEHTTLFYGDEMPEEGVSASASDAAAPLAPRNVFSGAENHAAVDPEATSAGVQQFPAHTPIQTIEPGATRPTSSDATFLSSPFQNELRSGDHSSTPAESSAPSAAPTVEPKPLSGAAARNFAPALVKPTKPQHGSFYLPTAKSGAAPAIPANPFAVRPNTKK
jgi:uncharacterized repeat protein (TIGR01451 family)